MRFDWLAGWRAGMSRGVRLLPVKLGGAGKLGGEVSRCGPIRLKSAKPAFY
jgi:hypothetical protein